MGQTGSANRWKGLIFAELIDSKAQISKAIWGTSLGIFIRAWIPGTDRELDCKETHLKNIYCIIYLFTPLDL